MMMMVEARLQVGKLHEHMMNQMAEMMMEERAAAAAAGRILIIGVFTAVLLALGMGVFVSRAVAKPLKELQDTAEAIAKGDLTKRAEVKGQDEIARVADAFNKMTERLLEARRLPENILRSMKDSLFVVDTKGKITEANQSALEALGYKKEDLIGKPISKVFGNVRGKTPSVEEERSDGSTLGVKERKQMSKVIKYIPAPEEEQE